ncbi:MAG: amidoligase family protein [Geminicoccaceae bacterium]
MTAPDGRQRWVGVELELAGSSARAAATLLRDLRGGRILERDPFRFDVEGSALGDVRVELDLRLAHPPPDVVSGPQAWLARAVGLAASRLAQVELIFPPLAPARLAELDLLMGELLDRAPGLRIDGPHLNPAVASLEPSSIVAHLHAFVRLVPELRAEMGVPTPGRMGFVTAYPPAYQALVSDPGYRPDLRRLIDDYLDANPTRYRELDLLPLLASVDPERVRRRLRVQKIKPRPVFHWRMPAARPFAGVVADWNRWVAVERLAVTLAGAD